MSDKVNVFLSIPMREQKSFTSSRIFRDTWEAFFRTIVAQLLDVEEDDIVFARTIVGEPASDYIQTGLFKASREMYDMMSGCDVAVFPADWENHQNCVLEAYAAVLYGMKTIAVTNVECEQDSDVTDVYMNTCNIYISDSPIDEPNEIGMMSDVFDQYTKLFIEESFDIAEITQMRERGD